MPVSVIGLGSGGHVKGLIEILLQNAQYQVIGLLDRNLARRGQNVSGVPILGDDALIPELVAQGVSHFFIGIGSVGSTVPRMRLYELARTQGLTPIDVVHPTSVISPSAKIGQGLTALAYSIINADVSIGENVLINSGAIVEHDCHVGDHVHIATRATLAGTVHVQAGAHIGVGATVRQGITIGRNAIVGAGAVVVHDVADDTTVVGVPARPLARSVNKAHD